MGPAAVWLKNKDVTHTQHTLEADVDLTLTLTGAGRHFDTKSWTVGAGGAERTAVDASSRRFGCCGVVSCSDGRRRQDAGIPVAAGAISRTWGGRRPNAAAGSVSRHGMQMFRSMTAVISVTNAEHDTTRPSPFSRRSSSQSSADSLGVGAKKHLRAEP